ncbi:hypothetical protein SBV1_850023 [Verrucomicrobia bacterium]|nr:hypothetical protein SBV1_850023 [Verrucomicrobiota bacterium]
MRKTKFSKTVELTFPPGEVGPICSYSPYCSPSDRKRNLGVWRKATITMEEEDCLAKLPQNQELELINTWILQMVRRELTCDLEAAEKELGRPLEICIGACAAEIIQTALALRVQPPQAGTRRRGSGRRRASRPEAASQTK